MCTSCQAVAPTALPAATAAAAAAAAAACRRHGMPTLLRLARLQVDGEVVSRIGPGLLCLVGLREGDTEKDAEYMWVPAEWECCMRLAARDAGGVLCLHNHGL